MASLTDYNHEYRFGAARLSLVLDQVRLKALDPVHLASVRAVDAARPAVDVLLECEERWTLEHGTPPGSTEAQEHAREIATCVRSIHGVLDGFAKLGRKQPLGRLASDALFRIFPGGLKDHIQTTYAEQVTLNDKLVRVLRSSEHAQLADDIGVRTLVDRIAAQNAPFRLLVMPGTVVRHTELLKARDDAEEAVVQVVQRICAAFDLADPAQCATRDAILWPYLAMKRQLRREMRVRHTSHPSAVDGRPPVEVEAPDAASPDAATSDAQARQDDVPTLPDARNAPLDAK